MNGSAGMEDLLAAVAGVSARVLLVDDEPNILNALRRLLRPFGYEIETASSGEEALALLETRGGFDAIVSDMRMPGMDGAQFLEASLEHCPEAVRILLTGHADTRSAIDAINRGRIFRYVTKPWDEAELTSALDQGLRLKFLEAETRRLQQLTAAQNEELRQLNEGLEQKVQERTLELANAMSMLEKSHGELKRNFHDAVRVFAGMLELRGGNLAGHGKRVAETARAIAMKMRLPPADTQDVVLAGLLHDIGKIALSDAALGQPPAAMNAEDRAALAKHPARGEAVLMGLNALRSAARLVRHHHERFDGQGYPDRLLGSAIPLGARIIAVAEDFDELQLGLVESRRYNADQAVERIAAGRGKRYDPDVVDAFLATQGIEPTAHASPSGVAVRASALVPGMVLARDLQTRDGLLLLARAYVLDEGLIQQIRSFSELEGAELQIYVHAPRHGRA